MTFTAKDRKHYYDFSLKTQTKKKKHHKTNHGSGNLPQITPHQTFLNSNLPDVKSEQCLLTEALRLQP